MHRAGEVIVDRDGWPVLVGSLVRFDPGDGRRPVRGYVQEVDESARGIVLLDAKTAGRRYVDPRLCRVQRPTSMDRARQSGQRSRLHEVSERAKRARRLSP